MSTDVDFNIVGVEPILNDLIEDFSVCHRQLCPQLVKLWTKLKGFNLIAARHKHHDPIVYTCNAEALWLDRQAPRLFNLLFIEIGVNRETPLINSLLNKCVTVSNTRPIDITLCCDVPFQRSINHVKELLVFTRVDNKLMDRLAAVNVCFREHLNHELVVKVRVVTKDHKFLILSKTAISDWQMTGPL